MLDYDLIGAHQGVRLLGHLSDFDALRKVVHDVGERSPLLKLKDNSPFFALAYALRKAFEADPDAAEEGQPVAANVIWPELLVTSRVLRDSLAYIDHGKRHQAMAYALEAVIEDAVREDFGAGADEVLALWACIDGHDEGLVERLDDIAEPYLAMTAAQRAARLHKLLAPSWIIEAEAPA